jgi:4-hydroxyphenylpyruvate dioxygenase
LHELGFQQVARHRSREVALYRQGAMNLVVNSSAGALPGLTAPAAAPRLAAIALRVRDAAHAYQHALDLGAWEIPTRASAMELNIPGIRGVGDTLIYFVDRYQDFSIYDVDFVPLPGVDPNPPAIAGLHYFGVVQSILPGRGGDWLDFYESLLGFTVLPSNQYFGVVPKGMLLQSPCRKFYLQLFEPPPGAEDVSWNEELVRIGFGAADIGAVTRALGSRGIRFVDRGSAQPSDKGALTAVYLGGASFEFVKSQRAAGG